MASVGLTTRQYVFALAFLAGCFLSTVIHAQGSDRDGFIGQVVKSDRLKPGQEIVFANLRSPRPFVTWPSGSGDETNRVFEDDETMVLFFVAKITGSTETFYINKKTRRFTLIEVGALQATATGAEYRPQVTYGAFK